MANCFKCSTKIEYDQVHRGDTCSKCLSDLRVCKNCEHYSESAYNSCKESQADRVVEKEKANFCDYFALSTKSPSSESTLSPAEKARMAAEALFKKK